MAMALSRYPWGVSSLQVPTQHIPLTNISTRIFQVSCRAQTSRLATGKSSSIDQKSKKKKKIVKRKKVEKPSGKKNESREKEDEEGFAVIPQMSEWINNKPSGFGVEKEYNTSLEDELLVDIQREEELRAAAEARKGEEVSATGKKLERKPAKNGDVKLKKEMLATDESKSSKPMQRITLRGDRVVERKNNKSPKVEKKPQLEEPAGVKVKLTHLPKKKNIRKDLRDAFKDVQGLLFIKPNELANKKTRDPLCKGSALLTFANEENAKFFIEKFKARKLDFGKMERVITYELLPEKVKTQPEEVGKRVPRLKVREPVTETATSETELLPVEGESVTEGLVSNSLDEHETEDEDEGENDVVLDAIVSASMDEYTEDESLEEEDEEDEEDDIDEGEFETLGSTKAGLEGMELSDELEYADSEDEDEYSEEDEEDRDTRADMDVSDDEYSDEDQEFPVDQLEQDTEVDEAFVPKEGYVEVDISVPLTAKDLGGDPEEIIYVTTEKMEDLDKQISQLKKKLKRKKSKELEAEILKLKEEKIELLEKRVLARVIAAREAFRAKKAAKQQESDLKKTGRRLRDDDERLKEVVSKHFTSQTPTSSS